MIKYIVLNDEYRVEGEQIAYFNAQIEEDGNYYTSRNIYNSELYQSNKQNVRNAFNQFEDEIIEMAKKVKENGICI